MQLWFVIYHQINYLLILLVVALRLLRWWLLRGRLLVVVVCLCRCRCRCLAVALAVSWVLTVAAVVVLVVVALVVPLIVALIVALVNKGIQSFKHL